MMVSRSRATLTLATRLNGQVALESWHQGQELQDEVRVEQPDWTERIPVCPDAFFVLRLTAEQEGRNRVHVFLEADRGTMTLKRVLTKLRGYWHYWRSDKQEERFGMKDFLVLTVSRTTEGSENLSAVTRELDAPKHRGLRMFLFGSEQNYNLTDPERILEPIWATVGDRESHTLLE